MADLPDYVITDRDRMMDGVYGDHVHQNDGTHLNGGIADDAVWPLQQFDCAEQPAPTRKGGDTFIDEFSNIIEGVFDRKWNFERAMVFTMAVYSAPARCAV